MIPSRVLVGCCALALSASIASAADVPAQTVGCRRSCYDPYERVGPIRRAWRALFRTPCPPQPIPVAVGFPIAPAPACCPEGPRVEIGRPVPPGAPPALPEAPPPSPPGPFTGSSRVPVTTPPSALRYERMASREKSDPLPIVRAAPPSGIRVLLIHADKTTLRHRLMTDERGGLTADLAAGDWLVYSQNDEGALTFRGKVRADEGRPVRVDLRK